MTPVCEPIDFSIRGVHRLHHPRGVDVSLNPVDGISPTALASGSNALWPLEPDASAFRLIGKSRS